MFKVAFRILRRVTARGAFFAMTAMLVSLPAANAALTVDVANNVDPVRASELINLEMVIANTDAFDRTGVVLTVEHPTGLNQTFETQFDGDCPGTTCFGGETITYTIGTVPAGRTVSVTLPAVVVSGTGQDGTVLSFNPSVTDDSTDVANDSTTLTIDIDTFYDLTLTENSDPALAGAQLTYKLTYGYRADAAATNASSLRFAIPAGTTFVSATGGGTLNAGDVEWNLGSLSPGDGGVEEVTVQIGGGLAAGDVLAGEAEIFNTGTPTEGAVAEALTAIEAGRILSIAYEANSNPARPFDQTHAQLTVSNHDSVARNGVTLEARFPQEMGGLNETEFRGDCASTSCTGGERVTWTLGTIPAGGTSTVTLPTLVSGSLNGGQLINVFTSVRDDQRVEARLGDSIRVQSDTLYDLSLSENADPATAGSSLTYKLTFGYRTDAAAVNESTLRLPLPPGATFVSATDGGVLNGGAIEWDLGFLGPGDSGIREATVTLSGGLAAGDVVNAVAEISANSVPSETALAEANTVIGARPLTMAIEMGPNPGRSSNLNNLQLTVTNNDPFTRFGVQIEGQFPQRLNQVFEINFDGNCGGTTCFSPELMQFPAVDIPAGGSFTYRVPIVLQSTSLFGTLIDFFVWAEDDSGVQVRQLDTLPVQNDMVYELGLSETADPATAGSELSYQLKFGYLNTAAAVSDSTLRFAIPVGTTFASASHGGSVSGGDVVWSLGNLSPGDTGARTVAVTLDAGLAAGEILQATADIFSVATPIEGARAEANTVIAASIPLSMTIESNPDAALTFENATLQLVVTNNDPFTRFGVTPRVTHPQNTGGMNETEFEGDCGSTSCTTGEVVTFPSADIPAGGTYTVQMPSDVANVDRGRLIHYYAWALDDQGVQTRQVETVRIEDSFFDVAIDEDLDALSAGSLIDYKITFGYDEDAAAVIDGILRLPVPTGTSFVSATNGGVLNGDVVEWALGNLDPGEGGIRQAVMQIDFGTADGTIIEAEAEFGDANTTIGRALSEATSIVSASVPLTIDVDTVIYGVAGQPLEVDLTVTNNDPFPRFGVTLQAYYPENLNQLFESDPNFDGDCTGTTCFGGELITWPAVDLAAGESVTVSMAPVINSSTDDGVLINFYAWANDDQGAQARDVEAVFNGCLTSIDNDCDFVLDTVDNCLFIPNVNQRDTDGDGIGNFCDADIATPNNCIVNALDLGFFKAAFFSTPGAGNWNPDADFNGDDVVNAIDLGILKSQFFQAPGPSGIPNLCDP